MDSKYGIYLAALAVVMLSSCSETSEEPVRAQIGEPCSDQVLCDSNLVCVNSICAEPSDDKRAGLGEFCSETVLCEDSLVCSNGICAKPSDKKAGLGEACSETVLCETGLVCTNSICAKAGECTTDNDCTDAKCVDGKCVPNQKVDCKNGKWETDKCVCNDLFKTDQSGICTLCIDGYTLKDGACVKDETPKPPVEDECKATFYYTDKWTRVETGGAADFDVYLAGSFNQDENSNWNPTDPKYKMNYAGRGVHSISIDVKAGDTIIYKYFVNGWGDDSWKTDPANTNTDQDGNSIAKIDKCGMEFGNKAGIDTKPVEKDCKHGTWNGSSCVCADGYKSGDDGICTLCADGYKQNGESCVKDESKPLPPEPQPDCKATFFFASNATSVEMGGAKDFDVYLVGDFNNWKPADPAYKMKYDGKGIHSVMIDVAKDQTFKYKFYVDGWENPWQIDTANPDKDTDGNAIAKIDKCDLEFGNKVAPEKNCHNGTWNGSSCVCAEGYKSNDNGICLICADGYKLEGDVCKKDETQPEPQPPAGDCKATFSFSNQWTNTETGGAKDFDVYLVGEFNAWKPADANYKMTYKGKGVHAITIDVVEGKEYKYKFYVDGWEENSWQEDPANADKDADKNAIAKINKCGVKFGSDAGFEPTPVDCGNGKADQDGKCVCSEGYALDELGKCLVCAEGYIFNDQNKCVRNEVPEIQCPITFTYSNQWTNKASGGADDFEVYLVGSFNVKDDKWVTNDPKYKMTSDGKGTHTITIDSKVGDEISYKYYVNGWADDSWKTDPVNTAKDKDGNSLAKVEKCGQKFGGKLDPDVKPDPKPDPTPDPNPGVVDGGIALAAVPTVKDGKISFNIKLSEGFTVENVTGGVKPEISGNTVTDKVTENNRYNYIVKAKNGDKVSELYVPVWVEDKGFDWRDALLYFAFTDRFADGDKSNNNPVTDASHDKTSDARWMGGDFKGLQQKVEEGYFTKLGVNTLWISSVSMNTQGISWGSGNDAHHSYSAYHSYWPISSFMTDYNKGEFGDIKAIEPHFGSLDDLKSLVNACHKKGIRVLVDFAANHVHKDSPMLKKHPDWFNGNESNAQLCDDNGGWDRIPETCWFSKDLPDINYNNADARRYMVDHAVWLIKQTGIDGFRVDAVKHMAIQFIKELRTATDKLFANTGIMFYMVGETFSGDANLLNKYIGNDLLHAQFDFQLYFQMNNLLKSGSMYSVANAGMYGNANTYKSNLMGTFIGNHDVARAISVAANQNINKWGSNSEVTDWVPYFRLKQAFTILLTNPGVPLIYYGDEYGMEGANDPDNRRMMKFENLNDQQKGTLDYMRKLGTIRAQHPAITRGKRENIMLEDSKWCYKVTDNESKETIIVGVANDKASGSCNLKQSYNLVDLLNDGAERKGVTSLDLGKDRFQIYLVK